MKKVLSLIATVILMTVVSGTDAFAKGGFTVNGGLNFPSKQSASGGHFDMHSATGWHAGVGYQTSNWHCFALHPQILFKQSGINWKDDVSGEENVKINSLDFIVNVQMGLDLVLLRPFIFAAPYVSANLGSIGNAKDFVTKATYGVGFGLGLDIWRLQIAFKYNWAFNNVVDWASYKAQYQGLKTNNAAYDISIAFKF